MIESRDDLAEVLLEVEHLTVRYPESTTPAIADVNLTLRAGEVMLITGASGCGKSTLLSCLRGLIPGVYEATVAGRVTVSGTDVSTATLSSLATEIGLVLQEPSAQLCNLTVETEVAFGVENLGFAAEVCLERVTDSLASVGLSHKRYASIEALSGGEVQRLAIASVLAMKPRVILLDEPTATLDSSAAAEVLVLIESLRAAGHAIIVVQHDFEELLPRAQRMLVMDHGAVIASGSPREVVAALASDPDRVVALPAVSALAEKIHGAFGTPLDPEELVAALGAGPGLPEHEAEPPGDSVEPPVLLSAVNLSFSYSRSLPRAVDDVSIDFRHGQTIALVGRNGSGKSTLARLLVGLLAPSSGGVELEGTPVKRLKHRMAIRSTGYVFQFPEHQFVTSTVRDEIGYGLVTQRVPQEEVERAVLETAQRLQLDDKLDRHPFTLSGGEKRRLSVATMLVLKPHILVLDEPTYGLDEANLDSLVALIFRELREVGTTIIVITHDMRLVSEHADSVIAMSSQRAVFTGSPADFFASEMLDQLDLVSPPLMRAKAQLRENGWPIPHGALTIDTIAESLRLATAGAGTR